MERRGGIMPQAVATPAALAGPARLMPAGAAEGSLPGRQDRYDPIQHNRCPQEADRLARYPFAQADSLPAEICSRIVRIRSR